MNLYKTPLRYPGGKQRLTPFIDEILTANEIDGHYVEPYAGGAGVAMELLLTNKVKHVHLNDSSIGIYAFWYSVVNHNEEFCRRILTASMTVKEWRKRQQIVRNADASDLFELGFSVFYLNRCNRSGVLTGGLIGGLDQTGNYKMDARFNRNALIQRVEAIGDFSRKIHITQLDAEYYITNYIPNLPNNALIYLDPPYYNKARDLYLNAYKNDDHARLSEIIRTQITHRWVLSYDGVPEITMLYKKHRNFIYDLQYTAAKVHKGKEIFIFGDNLVLPRKCILPHVNEGLRKLLKRKISKELPKK